MSQVTVMLYLIFSSCATHGNCTIAAQAMPFLFQSVEECESTGKSARDNYSAGDEIAITYTCVVAGDRHGSVIGGWK